jgi:TRAP-type C4-dicarboxylate transport system permease large subunit
VIGRIDAANMNSHGHPVTTRAAHVAANAGIGIAVPDGTIDGVRSQATGNVGGDGTAVVYK